MLGMATDHQQLQQHPDDPPKRRSTFYVSLDGCEPLIPRHHRSATCESPSEAFPCNTFPISSSKTAPNVPFLLRGGGDSSSKKNKHEPMKSNLEPRGKVQSLTRIFESSKQQNGGSSTPSKNGQLMSTSSSTSSSPSSNDSNEARKKVERTRSFKTIERFQNRFVGGKSKDQSGQQQRQPTKAMAGNHEVGVERRAIPKSREPAKSIQEQDRKGKVSNSSGPSLANLIRRTHSTKLARSSSSTLIRSPRHASIDNCNALLVNNQPQMQQKNEDVDSGQEENLSLDEAGAQSTPVDSEASIRHEETDTDAGVHSGAFDFWNCL
ncbi:hypothetical protein QAD02_004288 [Eretmocerus hayati]|uniref:Uncharacterized protein n=1 Tax=Eretmocerus hayati TaxID=131215 RepID=A0ACC2NPI5_9HYME|nr:hypothetical protein QAD02_004288 [Eretmocerus hayati]